MIVWPASALMTLNTTPAPGRTSGYSWARSPRPIFSVDMGVASPPSAVTCWSVAPLVNAANTIVLVGDQVAEPTAACVTVMASPPAVGTFLMAPPVQNPIHVPSGEKNGNAAPSVPGIGVAES